MLYKYINKDNRTSKLYEMEKTISSIQLGSAHNANRVNIHHFIDEIAGNESIYH